MGEWRYSSIFLYFGTGRRYAQLHAQVVALPPAEEPSVPTGEEAVCAPEPVWTLCTGKSLGPDGNWTPAILPVALLYTEWAISAPDLRPVYFLLVLRFPS
jgi:hypothetical protein